jgi:hypothetical protein
MTPAAESVLLRIQSGPHLNGLNRPTFLDELHRVEVEPFVVFHGFDIISARPVAIGIGTMATFAIFAIPTFCRFYPSAV